MGMVIPSILSAYGDGPLIWIDVILHLGMWVAAATSEGVFQHYFQTLFDSDPTLLIAQASSPL